MAYGTEALSTQEIDDAALDKPLLSGDGAQSRVAAIEWSDAGSFAGASLEDASYPTGRAYDRGATTRTRPSTAAATRYLLFNLATSPPDIDFIAIINHNLGTIGGGATVAFEIANGSTFAGAISLASWTPTTNVRLVDLTLGGGNNRYTTVPYARLVFTNLGASKPEVGEVWFGKRRQMPHWPQHPWEPAHVEGADNEVFDADGGDLVTYQRHGGRFEQSMEMKFATDANAAILTGFWSDCSYGAKKGIVIPKPNSAPTRAHLCAWPGGLPPPAPMTPSKRRYRLDMREAAPFYSSES